MTKKQNILSPIGVLNTQRRAKKEVGTYRYQTKSPVRNVLQSTFGSTSSNLSQRGYTSKEIRRGMRNTKQAELNRQRAYKTAKQGFGAVLGF